MSASTPMPNTSVTSQIASIGKAVQVITNKIGTDEDKSLGLNKVPRVAKAGMPTHVAVEHGIKPPAHSGNAANTGSASAYALPN